jgi:hypothetical protein
MILGLKYKTKLWDKIYSVVFETDWVRWVYCFVWCTKTGSDTPRYSRTDDHVWTSPGTGSAGGFVRPRDLEVILTTPSALRKLSNSWSSVILWGNTMLYQPRHSSYKSPSSWLINILALVGWGDHCAMSLLSICPLFVRYLSAFCPQIYGVSAIVRTIFEVKSLKLLEWRGSEVRGAHQWRIHLRAKNSLFFDFFSKESRLLLISVLE